MIATRLDPTARSRALALIGVRTYRMRAAPAAQHMSQAESAPLVATADARSTPWPARLLLRLSTEEAGTAPLRGRYGKLLGNLIAAAGLDATAISFEQGIGHTAVAQACFGTAPGDSVDAVLAPPLASLRQSAAAKRALWPQWRKLRARLAQSE